jgi:hypothetical protein
MKIILDFDDVIFNTRKFTDDYKKIFYDHGISEDIFEKCYRGRQSLKKGTRRPYDPQEHLVAIKALQSINVKGINKQIDRFIRQANKYIFPDAIEFLKKFNKNDLYLVSYGDGEKFQGAKIKSAKIGKYFRKIIILNRPKLYGIREVMGDAKRGVADKKKNEAIFFLDDRVELIEEVKRKYSSISTILMKRKEGRYDGKKDKYCDFEVKNLKEAAKLIEKLEENKRSKEILCAE